jgi:hypothetical protein
MNKDVASIIAKYARPRIWKYWFYNLWLNADVFKRTYIKQADTEKELLDYIFLKHGARIIESLVKHKGLSKDEGHSPYEILYKALEEKYLRIEELIDY